MKSKNLLTLFLFLIGCIIAYIGGAKFDTLPSDYGATQGFFHGLLVLFAVIEAVILGHNIAIYAPHNTGGTYLLGFLVGVIIFIITTYLYYWIVYAKKEQEIYSGDSIEDRMYQIDHDDY